MLYPSSLWRFARCTGVVSVRHACAACSEDTATHFDGLKQRRCSGMMPCTTQRLLHSQLQRMMHLLNYRFNRVG